MQIAFPFQLNPYGLVAAAEPDEHIWQMIEQVLFTTQGERVNLPEFGCGLAGLVFTAASSEMLTATQAIIQAALQRWLWDLIQVEAVQVEIEESTLRIAVQYIVLQTQQRQLAQFQK